MWAITPQELVAPLYPAFIFIFHVCLFVCLCACMYVQVERAPRMPAQSALAARTLPTGAQTSACPARLASPAQRAPAALMTVTQMTSALRVQVRAARLEAPACTLVGDSSLHECRRTLYTLCSAPAWGLSLFDKGKPRRGLLLQLQPSLSCGQRVDV